MSRKSYIVLAKQIGLLAVRIGEENAGALEHFIESLCSEMKQDNKAFDKARFVEAIEAEKKARIEFRNRAEEVMA